MRTQKRNFMIGAAAIAIIIGVGACYQANASDMPTKYEPRTVQAPSIWDGFWIGAHGGYGWGSGSGSILGAFAYSPDPEGWLYGLHAGAQKQYGSMVWGLQADISKGNNLNGTSAVSGAPAGVTASYDIAYLATAEVKLGLDMGRWLPHMTAGGACAQGKGSTNVVPFDSGDTYHCGWTVGGGLDLALSRNIIITARYQYMDLGTADVAYPIPGGGGLGISTPLDLEAHVFKLGASAKF